MRIKIIRHCVVTRSMLVLRFFKLERSSLFASIRRKERLKLFVIAILSLFKNGVRRLKNENYICGLHLWCRGYYHWMTEVAPKFVLFNEIVRNGVILLPPDPPKFMLDSLELCGLEKFTIMKGNSYVEEMVLIGNGISGHPDPDIIFKFRNFLINKVPSSGKVYEKVYISRRNAERRKVINDPEVIEYLRKEQFVCLDLENTSLSEQVDIFRSCKILISIHGAGLSNMMFMNEKGSVIEIYPRNDDSVTNPNPCFLTLSNSMKLSHYYLLSERGNKLISPNFHTDNVIIDINELGKTLNLVYSKTLEKKTN